MQSSLRIRSGACRLLRLLRQPDVVLNFVGGRRNQGLLEGIRSAQTYWHGSLRRVDLSTHYAIRIVLPVNSRMVCDCRYSATDNSFRYASFVLLGFGVAAKLWLLVQGRGQAASKTTSKMQAMLLRALLAQIAVGIAFIIVPMATIGLCLYLGTVT